MHTIKGNARTYGLLHLTHEVHDAEQSYDDLRNDVNRVADVTRLMHELKVRSMHWMNIPNLTKPNWGAKARDAVPESRSF